MQKAQVLKHFGISHEQFVKVLTEHGVEADLKFMRVVPDHLVELLTRALRQPVVSDSLAIELPLARPAEPTPRPKSSGLQGLEVLKNIDLAAVAPELHPTENAVNAPRHPPHLTENKERQQRPEKSGRRPVEKALQLGQIQKVVAERGFGFLHKKATNAEVFWHISALRGQLPEVGDWVLFEEGFNPRRKTNSDKPLEPEVIWAQPLGQDIPLLQRFINFADVDTLHQVLAVGPEETRRDAFREVVKYLPSIADADTLTEAIRTLDRLRQPMPLSVPVAVKTLLANTAPELGWQLWLRYLSPLAETVVAAAQMADLLATAPAVVTDWLPRAQQVGLVGLCLGYIQQDGEEVTVWLKRLQAALGQHEIYTEVVSSWLKQAESVSTEQEFIRYQYIARTAPLAAALTDQQLFEQVPPDVQLKVWERISGLGFPQEAAINYFDYLSVAEQDQAAARFDDAGFAQISGLLTAENSLKTRQRARTLLNQQVLFAFGALGLDLESDRKSIHEIAWGRPGAWHTGKGEKEVAAVVQELRELVASGQPYLLAGHNVRDFDAGELARHEVVISNERQWDTFLVEMALSPDWRVFALKTEHTAEVDAALTLQLFQNQALRLALVDEGVWQTLAPMFSPAVQAGLRDLRTRTWGQWLTLEALDSEAQAWLRPQPTASAKLRMVRQALADNPAQTRVVLASRSLWGELSRESGMRFLNDEESEPEFRELHQEAVLNQLIAHPVEAVLADRFFAHCQQAQLAPVPANMVPAVRVRLQQHVTFAECYAPPGPPDWQTAQCLCLTVEQLLAHHARLRDLPELAVLVVAPDLITLGHKRLLLDGLSVQDLLASGRSRTEWVKFSGGQSFVGLTLAQVEELGVLVPMGYHRFWLEKHRQGSYRVWGSFDWEPLLAAFAPEVVRHVDTEEISFRPEQLTCVAVHAQRLQQRLGVTAFNPESIYRARYWLLQAELLASIGRHGSREKPVVLLVQRGEELAKLAAYFRKLGYYVPEPEKEASLGRQLELLHESDNPQRLVIAPLERAAALLQANYRGPLEVVLDSFNLLENFYLAQGSTLFERTRRAASGPADVPGEPDEEDPGGGGEGETNAPDKSQAAPKREFLARDLHFLLELQRPVVQQLRALVVTNDPQSRLWLLDPRLEEFGGLAAAWQMQKSVVDVSWADTAAYEAAVEQADAVFGGARPGRDFELNLKEAKELLAQVFLRFREKGQWVQYDWKTEQVPYLDKILPAETDLLVSLPTGGGKSLLFQAPALYRSAYTNRLSIVVTPLKALMEDQVEGLWKRGFYSSVEYLNQDKQDETQQIYRRLAGGELALLFITPERFRSRGFAKAFAQRLASDGGLEYAIYDEAHCISQWGHEFRPDYLHSARVVESHRKLSEYKFPVLLFSATVTEKIYEGFNQLFG